MAKIETSKLFDEFFALKDPETAKRIRAQIDRPEVYAHEMKIGKQLIDMNVDELFDMISTFTSKRKENGVGYPIAYSSYTQIASFYRELFEFYSAEHEVIRNPWHDKRMKGQKAIERLAQDRAPFTKTDLDNIIKKIYSAYDLDRAKYIECVLQLFYNGFAKAREIVSLKEEMINFKTNEIRLPGKTITLSDHCMSLLSFVHGLTAIGGYHYDFAVIPYRGGYFKYIVRRNGTENFDDEEPEVPENMIHQKILTDVRKRFGVDINYRNLYLLGFYNFVVNIYGEERTKELILSVRNPKNTEDLMRAARQYGVVADNVTQLKKLLRPFI